MDHATRYLSNLTRVVLYTEMDDQCDKLVKIVCRTSTVTNIVDYSSTDDDR